MRTLKTELLDFLNKEEVELKCAIVRRYPRTEISLKIGYSKKEYNLFLNELDVYPINDVSKEINSFILWFKATECWGEFRRIEFCQNHFVFNLPTPLIPKELIK